MEPKNTDESAVFKTVTDASDQQSWLASLVQQIREYRNPPAPIHVTAAPDPEAVGLLIEQPTALGSMWSSITGMIEDWRHPHQYEIEGAEVAEIWGGRRYKTQVFSFVAYAALLGVLYAVPHVVKGAPTGTETIVQLTTEKIIIPLEPITPKPVPQAKPAPPTNPKPSTLSGGGTEPKRSVETPAPPTPAPPAAGGGGGGGQQALTEASKGKAPEFAKLQLVPPTIQVMNDDPKLVAPQTLVARNGQDFRWDIKTPDKVGDPLGSATAPPSAGPGTGGGIGPGDGHGVGTGKGPGKGPGEGGGEGGGKDGFVANGVGTPCTQPPCNGGGTKTVGGAVKPPTPIFYPNPAYSEDARKNKITGQVLLELVVKEDGTVDNIKLLRKLGYGLDESAITTVRTWKFKPGTEDGRPVPVRVTMEVTFRLL